jgi:hypothetical protein
MRVQLEQKIPAHLEGKFVELLGSDVHDLFLSRDFFLSSEFGFIDSFYFEFQNSEEEFYAEDLAWSVRAVSNYLYDQYVESQRKLVNEEFEC